METALERAVLALVRSVEKLTSIVMGDRRLRKTLTILFIVGAVAFAWNQWSLRRIGEQNRSNGRILVECTTRSDPTAKNKDDRVHECWEQTQAEGDRRVAQIVDANNNGVPDITEILERLGPTTTVLPRR